MHPVHAAPAPGRWLRWALLGLVASAAVAVLPFATGFLPPHTERWFATHLGWWRRTPGRLIARTLALVGSVTLFWVWLRLHPRRLPGKSPLRLIWLLWTLPWLLVPPFETADPYAYAAQGWLLREGLNPYRVPMGYPSPFASAIYEAWRPTTAVYPPLALHLQHLVVELTGGSLYFCVVGMRLLALVGVGIMVAATPLLARDLRLDPQVCLWAVALNPLVLFQFVGGAHNDTLMVGCVLAALWLAGRRSRLAARGSKVPALLWSMIVVGLAAAVKQPAVLAGIGVVFRVLHPEGDLAPDSGRSPALVRRQLPRTLGWLVAGGAIAATVFLAVSAYRGLWLGWMGKSSGSPNQVINHSPLSWLAQLTIHVFKVPQAYVDKIVTVLSGLLILGALGWLLRRFGPREPIRFTAGALLAFGILGPAIQPWYVLWGGSLLVFCRLGQRVARLATAVVLLLLISEVIQEFWAPPIAVPLAALPAYAYYRWGSRWWPPASTDDAVSGNRAEPVSS